MQLDEVMIFDRPLSPAAITRLVKENNPGTLEAIPTVPPAAQASLTEIEGAAAPEVSDGSWVIQQAEIDFMDYAIVGNATWSVEGDHLVIRLPLA